MVGQTVGYVRVSSLDQNEDRQLEGVELDCKFMDKLSGKNTERPELQRMLVYVRQGDKLVVHSLDRLARNLADLLSLVKQLNDKGVEVHFLKENLVFNGNNNTPMSMLMLSMLGAFAEFERALIKERQREGIEIAKKKGVYKGRKPSLNKTQAEELRQRAAAGEPKSALARAFGISRETVYQYLRS
ncbi:recombinase family protein [Alicyclobacillus acidiphilus]|uniref:recombinase family protein n=1 Tax=Alicyclobacillus acidiphilus TaxID=182455 RepID=UPI00082FC653|nr:recombinase family protein [Alicyclobacillus acidiphilus]